MEHLPANFDWLFYINYYPDLRAANIATEHEAIRHYVNRGHFEQRIFCNSYIEEKKEVSHKIKLLIFDLLFPVIHAKWRSNEINYFLNHPDFETDIFVYPYQNDYILRNMQYNVVEAYKRCCEVYPIMKEYNIMILNRNYNVLNQFNKFIDGTKFNGYAKGDFLFTKKTTINFSNYDIYYSIFLITRIHNDHILGHHSRCITKIYPGGGYTYDYTNTMNYLNLIENKQESVIITQNFMNPFVKKYVKNVTLIQGVPLISHNMEKRYKTLTDKKKLDLCFTTFSLDSKKGFDNYVLLARHIYNNYPNLEICFHTVGAWKNYPSAPQNMIFHGPMDPVLLDDFYYDKIDIITSFAKIDSDPDGFPLGGEAMIQGCIPILCDPHNANQQICIEDKYSLIIKGFDLIKIVNFIIEIYGDCQKLNTMSKDVTDKAWEMFDPEVQLYPIADLFKNEIERKKNLTIL